jgi:hypothetical protein
MKPHPAVAAVYLAATLLTTCGRAGANRSEAAPRPDPDVITAEELATTSGASLYDAVQALRPAWMLRGRPTAVLQQNQAQLIVYVDGTRYGNMDSLRQLTTSGIVFIRYYSPSSAVGRFGQGHLLGAIEVTTLHR